jgi:hypothetical protein
MIMMHARDSWNEQQSKTSTIFCQYFSKLCRTPPLYKDEFAYRGGVLHNFIKVTENWWNFTLFSIIWVSKHETWMHPNHNFAWSLTALFLIFYWIVENSAPVHLQNKYRMHKLYLCVQERSSPQFNKINKTMCGVLLRLWDWVSYNSLNTISCQSRELELLKSVFQFSTEPSSLIEVRCFSSPQNRAPLSSLKCFV